MVGIESAYCKKEFLKFNIIILDHLFQTPMILEILESPIRPPKCRSLKNI